MISLTQHPMAPSDLLRQRWEAITGGELDGVLERLSLNGVRRTVPANSELWSGLGGAPDSLLLVSGVVGETRLLVDGRRQILSLRLPGEVLQRDGQETLTTLTSAAVVDAIPLIRALGDRAEMQALRRAWVAAARADQAMMRDQIVRLGRLSAFERMAHLLVETHERLFHVGLATPSAFQLPVRQEVVADLLGMSVVHVSRVTQQLRRERLAQTRSSYVTLMDRERLCELSSYASRFAVTPSAARLAVSIARPQAARAS